MSIFEDVPEWYVRHGFGEVGVDERVLATFDQDFLQAIQGLPATAYFTKDPE